MQPSGMGVCSCKGASEYKHRHRFHCHNTCHQHRLQPTDPRQAVRKTSPSPVDITNSSPVLIKISDQTVPKFEPFYMSDL